MMKENAALPPPLLINKQLTLALKKVGEGHVQKSCLIIIFLIFIFFLFPKCGKKMSYIKIKQFWLTLYLFQQSK